MKNKGIAILKVIWVGYVLISIVFWLLMTDRLMCQDYSEVSSCISLNDDWNIKINDLEYKDVSLDDFSFDPVDKGDEITMERTLPTDWEIAQGTLRLHIRQTVTRIYIDNELIYEYGQERLEKHKTVGSGFQFIDFPNEYSGKTMRIELYVSENAAFSSFDEVEIYEWGNAYRALLTENRLPLLVGCFLVVFGLTTALITLFALFLSRKYVRLFCISLFSICVGLWTLCHYNVILVFSVPLYSVTLVEYMAMYLSMIPIDIYMYDNVKKLNSKVFNVLYGILFAALILFDTVVLTLHTLDIIHCVSVVSYLQVLILLNLLYFMVVLILNLRKSETFQRLLIIGMLIIAVCIGYDLVSFYLRRYFGGDSLPLKGVSSMGLMVFIMILFFSFYVNVAEKMMQDAERKSLVKCAYTDELTQLNNRRYCIEYMQKLENEQDVEVAIVSFDLNGLKLVNDTYGHIAGDALLRKAAEIIISTFENSGVVGRMGGDEFIAILVNTPEEDLVDLLERFRSNIMIANSRDEKSQVSIAYGYALSDEIDEFNIEKIYQIADYRMYENKNQSKSK